LSDLIESGTGFPDANGDSRVDGIDSDRDGILNSADSRVGFSGGTRAPLKDSNNNGIPDFMEISTSIARGSSGSDTIVGNDGDDILNGFSDPDIIYGGGGNDLISGGSDRDVLRGDEGNDTISGGTDNDDIQGGAGNDIISGGDGNDRMLGNDGDDDISGDRGNDYILGGMGKDLINGGDDRDRLWGEGGDDVIRGDRGNDLLVGGFGKDQLTGGQGRDTFRYNSVKEFGDVIRDFEIVKDRFDLRKIFHQKGSMSNLQLQQSGKDTVINVDFNNQQYKLGTVEDVNASTLKARHFRF
jgi:Ca2+-binding RTX toxin-like protein